MGCGSSTEEHPESPSSCGDTQRLPPVDARTNSTARPPTEAAAMGGSLSGSRSVSSASDVPQLFSPASLDRNMCSVREFGQVKDLMKKWTTWSLPRQSVYLDRSDTAEVTVVDTVSDSSMPGSGNVVAEALRLVQSSLQHRATETKYFMSPLFFTTLDVVTMTGILAHGHGPRACTAAADGAGVGIINVAQCLDALVNAVARCVVSAYSEQCKASDLVQAPRKPVIAGAVIGNMTRGLFGPAGSLEDPFVFAPPERRGSDGLNNYERYHRGVVVALKTLYIACGGTSALAGNLGQTGLPVVESIDAIFTAFRTFAIGIDGELRLDYDDAVKALAEFGTILAWIGLIPRPKAGSRAAEGAQALSGSVFAQGPTVLLSAANRRALVLLEFRVHRRRTDSALSFPRIPRRYGTLSHAIRNMARHDLVPKSMAAFSQASLDPATQCFASRPMSFVTTDKNESIASPNGPAGMDSSIRSPESPGAGGTRPAATFINLGARLLISRAGDSIDLRKGFGVVHLTPAEIGLTLSLGQSCIEHWESAIESGDIIEVGSAAYHVVEVSLASANTDDVDAGGTALVGLVTIDDPNRVEMIVILQRLGHNGGPDGPDSMSASDDCEGLQQQTLWLRKRVTPVFLPHRGGEYRFNDSLPQLSPEGVVLAETSVTSHLAGLQESKMRATESLRQMSQASSHMDTMVDHRSRKMLLETLQQFYFLGVLIVLAVVRDEPIKIRLPVLLFRILKSYRPSAAPAAAAEASPRQAFDDVDPTSSSFTVTADCNDEERQPTFSCHFVPTVEDLKEVGADAVIERVEIVRRMAFADFDRLLEREHLPPGTPKDDYIRDIIVAPAVATQSLRVYLDATFIAIADSGIHRSVTWQLSSPEQLRDICCRGSTHAF